MYDYFADLKGSDVPIRENSYCLFNGVLTWNIHLQPFLILHFDIEPINGDNKGYNKGHIPHSMSFNIHQQCSK